MDVSGGLSVVRHARCVPSNCVHVTTQIGRRELRVSASLVRPKGLTSATPELCPHAEPTIPELGVRALQTRGKCFRALVRERPHRPHRSTAKVRAIDRGARQPVRRA